MKKIKLLVSAVLISAACLSSSPVFAQGNTLDIDAVLDSAIQNSYKVKTQDINIQKTQNSYKDAVDNASTINSKIEDGAISLSYDQKVNLIKQRDNTPKELKYTEYKYTNQKEVVKNEVTMSIYQQYTTLMNAKDTVDTEKKRLDKAEGDYKKAQLQLSLGMLTEGDFKAAEYSYYTEKASYNKAERQYEIQTMNLNKLIGAPLQTKYDTLLKDKLTEKPYIRSYDDYLNEALKNRAEILNGIENIKLMNFEFITVKAFYPYTTDDEYKIGKYYVDAAQVSLDTQKINISLEINSLYNDLQNKAKKLQSQKDSVDYAKREYDTAAQKYSLGLISKLDADAKLIELQNQQNTLKALERDLWIAQIKLEYACKIGADSSKLSS